MPAPSAGRGDRLDFVADAGWHLQEVKRGISAILLRLLAGEPAIGAGFGGVSKTRTNHSRRAGGTDPKEPPSAPCSILRQPADDESGIRRNGQARVEQFPGV